MGMVEAQNGHGRGPKRAWPKMGLFPLRDHRKSISHNGQRRFCDSSVPIFGLFMPKFGLLEKKSELFFIYGPIDSIKPAPC